MGCKPHTESEWSDRMINRLTMLYGIGLPVAQRRLREMDGWMVYCIINGLTVTILWVNDEEHD